LTIILILDWMPEARALIMVTDWLGEYVLSAVSQKMGQLWHGTLQSSKEFTWNVVI